MNNNESTIMETTLRHIFDIHLTSPITPAGERVWCTWNQLQNNLLFLYETVHLVLFIKKSYFEPITRRTKIETFQDFITILKFCYII